MVTLLLLGLTAQAADVVVFGDSWAEGGGDELEDALRAAGHRLDVANLGVGGTTAQWWNDTAPDALSVALDANPDARWVWLSLLGNDTFQHHAESQGGSAARLNREALQALVDRVHGTHPDVKIVMFPYDYVNFEQSGECILSGAIYFPELVAWGRFNTWEINGIFQRDVGDVQAALAAARPWMSHYVLWGTLQAAGGIPGAPQQALPSPASFMSDCIHPTSAGYRRIHDRLVAAYWGHPTPTARIEDAPAAPVCEGQDTTLSAFTSLADAHTWFLDGTEIVGSATLTVPGALGDHTVVLRADGGAWRAEDARVVSVVAPPVVTMSEDAELCEGDGVPLSAQGGSVRWTPTEGLSDPGAPTPWATPARTTTYTATLTSAPDCEATGQVTVTVHPAPKMTLDVPDTVAAGVPLTWTAQVEPADTALTWQVDGETVGTGAEVEVTLDAGTHELTVVASSPEGCGATQTVVVDAAESLSPVGSPPHAGCGCDGSRSRAPAGLAWLVLLVGPLQRRRAV